MQFEANSITLYPEYCFLLIFSEPFQRQPHEMQQPTHCLSVFDHFVRLARKGLKQKTPK